MRTYSFHISSLILTIFLIGCFQENTVEFSNELLGYSIQYPTTWEGRIIYDELDHLYITTKKEQEHYGFVVIRSGNSSDFGTDNIREILANSSNTTAQETIELTEFNGYEAVTLGSLKI